MSRPWLALVLILFCLPLFIGLRSRDLEPDEAIYTFAVDKILEDGEWLQPKSSPDDTLVFLEKPPLKFWIVAAPIRAGLLPHDEFGTRFWDVLFAAVAFVYVFAIGSLLAGPICGAVAVLGLFVHFQLLFDHGLRTNSMEGPLFLSYCGGIYHFLAWTRRADPSARRHAVAVGLYFVLGFMTKFVAAIFLPAVIGAATLLSAPIRRQAWRARADWLTSALVVLGLTAPWFVWATVRFGSLVWTTMLAEHVYVRFTAGVDPAHLQPWDYYVAAIWRNFSAAGLQWFLLAGLLLLAVMSIRRRSFEGGVVLAWGLVPLTLISMGSSKLYHYAYPFLPPLTLAIGYLAALVMMLAPVVLGRWLTRLDDLVASRLPGLARLAARPGPQAVATTLMWAGAAVAIAAMVTGGVDLEVAGRRVFKSGGLIRPLLLVVLAAVFSRRPARAAALIVGLLVIWAVPAPKYREVFAQFSVPKHPIRSAAECVGRVQHDHPALRPGVFVDADRSRWLEGVNNWHPIYYYFRRVQPWTIQDAPSAATLARHLKDPEAVSPVIVREERYRAYLEGEEAPALRAGGTAPMLRLIGYTLLLPGPYQACSNEASLLARR